MTADIRTGTLGQRKGITAKPNSNFQQKGHHRLCNAAWEPVQQQSKTFLFKLVWTKSCKQINKCFKSQTFLNFEHTESWNRCLTARLSTIKYATKKICYLREKDNNWEKNSGDVCGSIQIRSQLQKLQRSSGSNTESSWLDCSLWNAANSKPVFLERHSSTKPAPTQKPTFELNYSTALMAKHFQHFESQQRQNY